MNLEFKNVAFELKDISDQGRIEGLASVYSEIDQGADVVVPGAFTDSLAAVRAGTRKIKMLWQHDPTQPIGVWDSFEDSRDSLKAVGRILPSVRKGAEALALLREQAMDGLSIGFRVQDHEYTKSDNGSFRAIKKADLWEVSVVTFPMNTSARVTDVKNLQTIRDVERILRDAGVPNSFAGLVAKYGFEGANARLNADPLDEGDDRAKAQVNDLITKLQRLKETFNA